MGTDAAKTRFIHDMGPYYLQALKEKQTEAFFTAAFRRSCDRWPDRKRYLDWDYRRHVHEKCRKRMENSIIKWAGLGVSKAELHWRNYFGLPPASEDPAGSAGNPIDLDDSASMAVNAANAGTSSDTKESTNANGKRRYVEIDSGSEEPQPKFSAASTRIRPRPHPRTEKTDNTEASIKA